MINYLLLLACLLVSITALELDDVLAACGNLFFVFMSQKQKPEAYNQIDCGELVVVEQ